MSDAFRKQIRAAVDEGLSGALSQPTLQQKVIEKIDNKINGSRKISLVAAFAMLLIIVSTAALAVTAFCNHLFVSQREIGTPNGGTIFGNKLYYVSYEGICEWTSETNAQNIILDREKLDGLKISTTSLLFHDEDTLYLFDQSNKKIWRFENQTLSELVDFTSTLLDQEDITFSNPVFHNNFLWLRAVATNHSEDEAELYRVNLKNMTVQVCWVKGIMEITAYEKDKLLVLQRDIQTKQERLLVLSANSGNVRRELFVSPIFTTEGIACSENENVIYAIVNGILSYWNGSGWTEVFPITLDNTTRFYGVLSNGYISTSINGILFHPFKRSSEEVILTIRGSKTVHNSSFLFTQTHPMVSISHHVDTDLSSNTIRRLMKEGDSTDIYHFCLDKDTHTLFSEGLALPLSSSLIEKDHAELTDSISSAVRWNEQIYAVPSMLTIPGYDLRGTSVKLQHPVRGWLHVYIINPNSPNKEVAIEYVSSITQTRAPQNNTYLKPDTAEPTLYPSMQEWIYDIEADQRAMDAESGIPTDEAALLERIEYVKNLPDMWEVTEAGINDYRSSIVPYLVLFD